MKKRRIAVILGSDSDLTQCEKGLALLKTARAKGQIILAHGKIEVKSIHRNTEEVLALLRQYDRSKRYPDVIITGAGWANHLSGVVAAYLRNHLKNTKISVIGVSFSDPKNARHTTAAKLSVSEVPGNILIYDDGKGQFCGKRAFERAVRFAMCAELPKIELPKPRASRSLSLDEALKSARS